MKKGVLRKAVSAGLALSLVIALMPTMFASAAEVGDTVTMGTSFTLYKAYEKTDATSFTSTEHISSGLGDYFEGESYVRNWRFFKTNWESNGDQPGFSGVNGLYFRGTSTTKGDWFALKVKGFESGVYRINVHTNALRGCVWELYLLDNESYGGDAVTSANITEAIDNMSSGVTKIGEVDLYGEPSAGYTVIDSTDVNKKKLSTAATNLDFGTATFGENKDTEYILVFRAKDYGVIYSGESIPTVKSEFYIAMHGISFTKTTAAKNSTVFGNTAAFVEHTDNGDANLYLVSAIDSINYSKVGFELMVDDASAETLETTTVYDKITMPARTVTTKATDSSEGATTDTIKEYTAANFGLSGKYLYVVKKTLSEGFTGQTIQFKPFAVNSTGEIAGSTYQATLKSN